VGKFEAENTKQPTHFRCCADRSPESYAGRNKKGNLLCRCEILFGTERRHCQQLLYHQARKVFLSEIFFERGWELELYRAVTGGLLYARKSHKALSLCIVKYLS
jgi:hypothetical protein